MQILTVFQLLLPAFPNFLRWIAFADDGIFLTVETCAMGYLTSSLVKKNNKFLCNLTGWFGLVAFLLPPPTSNAARLRTAFGNFELPAGYGKRVLAWATSFAWYVDRHGGGSFVGGVVITGLDRHQNLPIVIQLFDLWWNGIGGVVFHGIGVVEIVVASKGGRRCGRGRGLVGFAAHSENIGGGIEMGVLGPAAHRLDGDIIVQAVRLTAVRGGRALDGAPRRERGGVEDERR